MSAKKISIGSSPVLTLDDDRGGGSGPGYLPRPWVDPLAESGLDRHREHLVGGMAGALMDLCECDRSRSVDNLLDDLSRADYRGALA